jgi:uncharacterized protein (TIGR01777 family)
MRILIPGGSGFIGRALAADLSQDNHEIIILSRSPGKISGLPANTQAIEWDGQTTRGWGHFVDGVDAIVNLAGENIAGENFFPTRWTAERKARIQSSRTKPGQAINEAIMAAKEKPRVLVQSSAVGYYGALDDQKVDETNPGGKDYLAHFCQEWENTTTYAEKVGVRRVIIRSGIVLSKKTGALPRMMLPFKLFAGGPFGNGRQYISWIHLKDEIAAIRYLIENPKASGAYNLTSPNPCSNADFGRTLGKVMKRPYYMPVPGFAMKIAFGEVTTVVLDGQRVIPKRLLDSGFTFQFPSIEPALQDTLAEE